jgi:hypothetical protein
MQQAAYKPQDNEIQHLMQLLASPGYPVLQKIMMGEIDQFQLDLINVDPTKPNYETEVRAKHSIALAAGMFYQRLQETIAGYVNRLNEKHNQPNILPDPTESLLDY